MRISLTDVIAGSRSIPFTENEVRVAMDAVKVRRSKGADLCIGHPEFCESNADIFDAAQAGMMFFHSPHQLKGAFLFVKLDAGRGLLGGQKAVFASHVGSAIEADEWEVGTTFKMWGIAITSIGNVYRGYGFK